MKVILDHNELRALCDSWRAQDLRIGFVPTMGALHRGHEALFAAAQEQCDQLVVSIFVNPLQFSADEDGEHYPQESENDREVLSRYNVAALYEPPVEDVYNENFSTMVRVELLSELLCGAYRPHHFVGVTTVVAKLFNIIQPHDAFFGEKDYQQYILIARMAEDLNMQVRVHALPIVREEDGLAYSSRNGYLTEAQRACAPQLYQILQEMLVMWRDGGKRVLIEKAAVQKLLSSGFNSVDYVTIVDDTTLQAAGDGHREGGCRAFGAAWLGRARLIDNVAF